MNLRQDKSIGLQTICGGAGEASIKRPYYKGPKALTHMSSSYLPGVYRQNFLNRRRAGNARRTSRSKDVTKKQRDIKISKAVEPQNLGTE